ncbi:SCO4225 family membrane protein [Streptomyces sp. JW3]|uniref:SCO4225 family membrane protein n=1 Tax=Streptomyces sp. JW3 TaxID=3456955 RepID=UPI003FA41FA2
MPNATRPRRFLALATGNWPARGYLALVAASAPLTLLFPDAALPVDPVLLTAPLSFAAVVLPFGPGSATEGPGAVPAVALWLLWLTLCALVNAAAVGALAEGRAPAARTPGGRALRPRALLTAAVDNWPARTYLAVVAAALGFFLYAVHLTPDPGMAGIWPLLATAPLSFVAVLALIPESGWLGTWAFSAGVALSGLLNAALLGLLVRRASINGPHLSAP